MKPIADANTIPHSGEFEATPAAQKFAVPYDTPTTYLWSSPPVLIFCGWLLYLFAFSLPAKNQLD